MIAACLAAVVYGLGCGDPCAEPEPGMVCQLAGTGSRAFNGDGLSPMDTAFYLPSLARPGPDGRVYIVDFNNHRIRAIDGDRVITVVGSGEHYFASTGIPAIESPLENPIDMDFSPNGDLIFVSFHDPRLLRVDNDGVLRGVAGIGEMGDSGDGGPANAARFTELTGVAAAADGAVYLADGGAARVRVIRPDGTVEAYAGTGTAGMAGDGGPATAAQLTYPTALAVAPDGTLLIADARAHVVRRVDASGIITTIAGTGQAGSSGDGGPATSAEIDSPEGVAVHPADGSIYISEWGGHRIRRIDPGGAIETIAGTGQASLSGNGALARDAAFAGPARLFVSEDRLYVADQLNDCIRVIYLPAPSPAANTLP